MPETRIKLCRIYLFLTNGLTIDLALATTCSEMTILMNCQMPWMDTQTVWNVKKKTIEKEMNPPLILWEAILHPINIVRNNCENHIVRSNQCWERVVKVMHELQAFCRNDNNISLRIILFKDINLSNRLLCLFFES